MRSAWKTLLVRGFSRRIPMTTSSSRFQVRLRIAPNSGLRPSLFALAAARRFSSEPAAVEANAADHSQLVSFFSEASSFEEIKVQLESAGISMDHGTVNSVMESVEERPEVARRVFDWVLEGKDGILSSNTYNLMLGILGVEGNSLKFWNTLEKMKKKGYGLSKNTFLKVCKSFNEKGMVKDLDQLKEIYQSNSPENYVLRTSGRICTILRKGDELGDVVWEELKVLDIKLSPDLVAAALDRLCGYPTKAFMFFRWVNAFPSFTADGIAYNMIARILGREDCIPDFWTVLKEMRDRGYELEFATYNSVSKRFYQRKMVEEAVSSYEFALRGSDKPPPGDLSYILQKVVVSRELNLVLVSRVMRAFTEAGYVAKPSVFIGLLKALKGFGRLEWCVKLLKAMEEGGFVASNAVYDQIFSALCKSGSLDEAAKFLAETELSSRNLDPKSRACLVQRYSLAGSTGKALSCFNIMVERKGSKNVECALEALVNALCQDNRDTDACEVLTNMVNSRQLQPWHSTYKYLIERLLDNAKLIEASCLLGLMKRHGFPPFVEPFIDYISRNGSVDDAIVFLKATTLKSFSSISLAIRIFEALLKAGKHNVAHDLLSKTPGYVRNHADVLSLFFSLRSSENISAVPA